MWNAQRCIYWLISLKKLEMTFLILYKPFIFHAREFFWHIGALKVQIISKLLSVEWNVKFSGVRLQCNGIEIWQEASAAALGRSIKASSGEDKVLLWWDDKYIFKELFLPICCRWLALMCSPSSTVWEMCGGGRRPKVSSFQAASPRLQSIDPVPDLMLACVAGT